MKNIALALLIIWGLSSFGNPVIIGTWTFSGGIYNGKKEGAPKGYLLQRKYKAASFDAFLIEKGQKTVKYQAGKFTTTNDTYLETETYSMQKSQMTGKTITYQYTIRHDSLILRATLPTGMKVEEYWKKAR